MCFFFKFLLIRSVCVLICGFILNLEWIFRVGFGLGLRGWIGCVWIRFVCYGFRGIYYWVCEMEF